MMRSEIKHFGCSAHFVALLLVEVYAPTTTRPTFLRALHSGENLIAQ